MSLSSVGWESNYIRCRCGAWRLLVRRGRWNEALEAEVLRQVDALVPAGRPVTRRFGYPAEEGDEYYVKVYNRPGSWGVIKELFRDSKALRALKQGEALAAAGFHVPLTIAAGEMRKGALLRKTFLLTLGAPGLLLGFFLEKHYSGPPEIEALRRKREYLTQLALEVRRLHLLGFVHGDLTPFNILIDTAGPKASFFFVDNDRTRHYPNWLPQLFWRRNLVQLNRFLLPGISLQDRVRFLSHYLGGKPKRASAERRLAGWLEAATRKRIREWDSMEPQMSFRQLMKWTGSFDRSRC